MDPAEVIPKKWIDCTANSCFDEFFASNIVQHASHDCVAQCVACSGGGTQRNIQRSKNTEKVAHV